MAAGKSLNILIVDDSTSLRSVLRTLLINEGHRVVGDLARGHGLNEAVERLKPDVVCLDYHLPDGDGISFLTELHQQFPNVSVVMITANTDPDLKCQAVEAGATGFIRKPFAPAQIVNELRQIALIRDLLKSGASTDAHPPQAVARAVIADDNAAMRLLLTKILNLASIDVVGQGTNGHEAVALVAQHAPDIICLDIDMPVMNGFDALRAIRAKQSDGKIMMITGRTDRDAVEQAARNGATGYIVKPFQPDKVLQALKKLVG